MAETTAQAFLGMSINCAKCHNHPMEKWTNDQYYGIANLFARVRIKNGAGDGETRSSSPPTGRTDPAAHRQAAAAAPLDGKPHAARRPARPPRWRSPTWLTSPENPYFARAITNRVWANFFGVGLVETVDDMRVDQPRQQREAAQRRWRISWRQKFDLKALMRAILQSETYQRTQRSACRRTRPTRAFTPATIRGG